MISDIKMKLSLKRDRKNCKIIPRFSGVYYQCKLCRRLFLFFGSYNNHRCRNKHKQRHKK